jgi:hypothetical protein
MTTQKLKSVADTWQPFKTERVTLMCATGQNRSTVTKLSPKVVQNGLKQSKSEKQRFSLSRG